MYHWKQMSKQDTAFIKGVGMLLILFHNYSHFIQPWAGENEFIFSYHFTSSFITLVTETPSDIIRLLFAFFGHYGVQLFIFISGYGLFLSYRNKPVKWGRFFKKHILKLYPAYFLAVCLLLVLHAIQYNRFPPIGELKIALIDLLFIQNFIPGLVYKLVGPWWFFSLIVQLYAVFPLMLRLFRRFGIKAIVATGILCWLITLLLNPWLAKYDFNLYYFFIGRLPVFCLGILFAWLADFKLPWWLVLLSFVLVIGGNFQAILWPLTMLAVTIFLLVIIRLIIPVIQRHKIASSFLIWVGVNSLFIFAVHGFLRMPFVDKAMELKNPLLTIGLGLAFLAVSLIVSLGIKQVENIIQSRIIQPYFLASRKTDSDAAHSS